MNDWLRALLLIGSVALAGCVTMETRGNPPCDGVCEPEPVIDRAAVTRIAVDAQHIYFTDESTCSVFRIAKVGLKVTRMGTDACFVTGLSVTNDRVVWVARGRDRATPTLSILDLAPANVPLRPRSVKLPFVPNGLAVMGGEAYVAGGQGVLRIDLASGSTRGQYARAEANAIVAHAGAVYFYDGSVQKWELGLAPKALAENVIADVPSAGTSRAMAFHVDDSGIYWSTPGRSTTDLMWIPLEGGEPTMLQSVKDHRRISAISSDTNHVYWAVDDGLLSPKASTVFAAPIDAPTTSFEVAALPGDVLALQMDDTGLLLGARPSIEDSLAAIEAFLDGGTSHAKRLKGTMLVIPRDVLP